MESGELLSLLLSQPNKMRDTPVDSPDETSCDAPGETSCDTPGENSCDMPGETSRDNTVDPLPGDTSCETPGETSVLPGETSALPGESSGAKPSAKKGKMSQFDKFKRRLIRSVARMLITEKMEADLAWKTLEKETGRDCKTIWAHMRALTLRKLSRLLAADDYVARVGEVARMSPVDWLQFDLVLVHEDIDVWDMGAASNKNLVTLSAPWDLLQLAHQHDVIHSFGDQLALTWATITVHYNRKGRQCSPMLLQKRWHQLLRQTRDQFYVFWYEYRGSDTRFHQAKEYKPSSLQYTIAKCYPKIVTKQFPKWLDAMKEGQHRIVLVEELQQVMRDKQRQTMIEEGPELELMEPKIDTIEIGDDSDEEKADDDKPNETDIVAASEDNTTASNEDITTTADEEKTTAAEEVLTTPKVKTEPIDEHIENLDPDDGLSYVKIVTAAHVTTADIVDNDLAQLVLIDNTHDDVDLDENSHDDNIEDVVPSPNHATDEVASLQNLDTNILESVTKSPDLNADQQNLALGAHTINIVNSVSTTDSNTNKTDLNATEVSTTVEESDTEVLNENETLISPELVNDSPNLHSDAQYLVMDNLELTKTISDDMDLCTTDLNTNETDLNLPETDINKEECELPEKPDIIQDEILMRQTLETSNGNCNTSNISISETRSLNHDNITDSTCSEVQDMIVKTEHASQKDLVALESISDEQIEDNLPNFDIAVDTITAINFETNDHDTVSIANPCLQISDHEEDIIMYDPSLNVSKENAIESVIPETDVNIVVVNNPECAVIGDDAEAMEIVDEGVDDGEYLADEASATDTTAKSHDTSESSDDQPTKIDLKLIMNAIVFTTKLDSMKSLINRSYEEVKSDILIHEVLKESKPAMKLQTKVEDIINLKDTIDENLKIDANDESGYRVITNEVPQTIDFNKTYAEANVEIKMEVDVNKDDNAENNSEQYDEMDICQDEQESSEDEYEDVRINPNSKVFKKPNNVSYNPVQLCKNPDFNTRLKRIPILFYTYETNKEYLKECKPLTIDLDKGFERKMHNKTIYLKRDPNAVRVKVAPKINSTVPITDNIHETNQHISDNQPTFTQDQADLAQIKLETALDITDEELISERKRKLISLPDIVKVRRINQQLQTAEISPILKNESDNSNSCETIDLTSKQHASSMTNEIKTTDLNQEPIEPIAQSSKIPKQKAVPKKPVPRWYQIKSTKPVEKIQKPGITETVAQRVRRIFGDSLLTDDSVSKMLFILETDALDDEHVKKFFSYKLKPTAPIPAKKKIRKPKPTSEVVDQNIHKDELIKKRIIEEQERKKLKEVEKQIRDLERKQKKEEKEAERKEKLKLKSMEALEKKKQVLAQITPKINVVQQEYKARLLTIGENNTTMPNVAKEKKNDFTVKCKMLCRTPVQTHSTPLYSLRGGCDSGPKISVFADHHSFTKRPKVGMSFLVKDNIEKNLTMSPIILRNIGENKSEKLIHTKQTDIKPSPVPLSREQVRLNINQKDVILSAKFLSMFPANSSFGKDKIILTTANLDCFAEEPSPSKATPAPIVHSDSQQLFPPFEVPKGVRFYLTATGDVVGTVDAGITDPGVTNAIPLYVSTIKEILASASTSTMDVSESLNTEINNLKTRAILGNTVIDITQNETENIAATESVATTIDITQSKINDNMTSAATLTTPVDITELATETDEIIAATVSIATTTTTLDTLTSTKSDIPLPTESNLMDISQYAETVTQSNDTDTVMTEEQPNNVQESYDSASLPVCDLTETDQTDLVPTVAQKKSILSDLMAMTGITSEDTMSSKPVVEETPVTISLVPNILPVSNILSVTPLQEPTPYDLFSDLAYQNTNPDLKVLTPVTSFEMLKYANNETGEFYKLDLKTGIILPIIVGFKRVKTYAKMNNKRTVQTHATIDLTEEAEEGNVSGSNDQTKTLTTRILRNSKTHVLKRFIKPQGSYKDDNSELPVTLVCRTQPRSRKQNLRPRNSTHIDGVVNLSEFDEPVEEEHLEDSQESQTGTEPEYEEAEYEFDDATEELSSDEDEPLSAVISRRKSKDKTSSEVVAVTGDSQSSIDSAAVDRQSESISQNQRVLNFDIGDGMDGALEFNPFLYTAKNPRENDESMMNVSDDNASMNDSEIDSLTNDDDGDEDFILGV